jgi:hypothetical protein
MRYKDYSQDTIQLYDKNYYHKAQSLKDALQSASGIDVFKRSRKREIIEHRSLYNTILFEYLKYSKSDIQRIHQNNGLKTYNHASVIHSLNQFQMYTIYNKSLNILLEELTQPLSENDKELNIKVLAHKLEVLDVEDFKQIAMSINNCYIKVRNKIENIEQ